MNRDEIRNEFVNNGNQHGVVRITGKDATDAEFVAAIRSVPKFPQLLSLEIVNTSIGDDGLVELAQIADTDIFSQLEQLVISRSPVGDTGIAAIFNVDRGSRFPKLDTLSIRRVKIADAGLVAIAKLAQQSGLPHLQTLAIESRNLGRKGFRSFRDAAKKHCFLQLKTLALVGTLLDDVGAGAIASAAKAGGLCNLEYLDLSKTQLGNIGAKRIAAAARAKGFLQLQFLGLSRTEVGNDGVAELAAAAEAQHFPQLEDLELSNTPVDDRGVAALAKAAKAEGFPKLRVLSLFSTAVSDIGVTALAEASEVGGFPLLRELWLFHTKVTVAEEQLETKDPHQIFHAVKGTAILEAKVVVVGEPLVGKSWFCKRFFLDTIPSRREETHDIELINPIWRAKARNQDVDLRVWDFGGQHVMHGTHEMFLSQRSIAILVVDITQTLESNRVEYWQKLSTYCMGPRTPSIIVISKCDTEQSKHKIGIFDPKSVQFQLTQCPEVIRNFFAEIAVTSPDVSPPAPIAALKCAINAALERLEGLGKKISSEAAQMKTRVEREIASRSLVSIQEYHNWCREEHADDSEHSILRTLHNLGSVFFFGLTDRERHQKQDKEQLAALPLGEQRLRTAPRDSVLDSWIANPRWLTWSISEINRQSENAKRVPRGQLTLDEIEVVAKQSAVVRELKILPESTSYICGVLKLTELCWEIEKDVFLFPRGLPEEASYSFESWSDEASWIWEFLPEQMFHRFVVRMHERGQVVKIKNTWQHWRDAVLIEHSSNCRAVFSIDSARGHLKARRDPSSLASHHFAELCADVSALFEKEFVKQPARKHVPELGDWVMKFAEINDIRKAIVCFANYLEKRSACIPHSATITKWEIDYIFNKYGKKEIDIDQTISQYAEFHKKIEKAPLTEDERNMILGNILRISRKTKMRRLSH